MEFPIVGYQDWLMDFERRLALHDEGVAVLARDLAQRTPWQVRAGVPGFPPPEPRWSAPPDVVCERGPDRPPVVFEVELPETLVRRDTVTRLCNLVDRAIETHVVIIAPMDEHDGAIRETGRLLRTAGLDIPVAALEPRTDTLTGADW